MEVFSDFSFEPLSGVGGGREEGAGREGGFRRIVPVPRPRPLRPSETLDPQQGKKGPPLLSYLGPDSRGEGRGQRSMARSGEARRATEERGHDRRRRP